IEECFSFVKSYIHHHGDTFYTIVELGDPAEPFCFLYGTLHRRHFPAHVVMT
ncbi:hypothetical protein L208DRAFT_1333280, partial [Tricholoma matsutake]